MNWKGLFVVFAWSLLMMSGCKDRHAILERSFHHGEQFLLRHQRPDGAIADPKNRLFDTWETVWAAYALSYSKTDSSKIALEHAMAYLKAHRNPEGLLCHNEKCRAQHCIETSAAYALLLQRLQLPGVVELHEAIWSKRQPAGYWEVGNPDVREQKGFPSVTGFCVWTLCGNANYQDSLEASVDWILNSQNANGYWGAAWEYYGTEAYAIWACGEALHEFGKKEDKRVHDALNRTSQMLRKKQSETGEWDLVLPGLMKSPSPALQTALVLNLMLDKAGLDDHAAPSARDYLLRQQKPDGSWDGGHFPIQNKRYEKREDLFATAMTMIAFGKELEGNRP